MEPVKVVIRYVNGKVIKGFTQDFFPNKDRFHLHRAAKASGEAVEVQIKDLKAIFFVQDFEGNAQYNITRGRVTGKGKGPRVGRLK